MGEVIIRCFADLNSPKLVAKTSLPLASRQWQSYCTQRSHFVTTVKGGAGDRDPYCPLWHNPCSASCAFSYQHLRECWIFSISILRTTYHVFSFVALVSPSIDTSFLFLFLLLSSSAYFFTSPRSSTILFGSDTL